MHGGQQVWKTGEIAFLLRRLKERIQHHRSEPFRCIATSATLGSESGKASLAKFAEQLFGEPFDETDIITTERQRRIPDDSVRDFSYQDYKRIKEESLKLKESERGQFLYDKLVNDGRLFKLYDILAEKPKNINEVANFVFFSG